MYGEGGDQLMVISIRAYARMRGCAKAGVEKTIKTKRITTLPDGNIDPAKTGQKWAKTTFAWHPLNRAPWTSAATTGDHFVVSGRRSGRGVPARASEYAATFPAIVRDRLADMPDRLSPMLAAVHHETAIHRMPVAEVSPLLREVSKAVADAGL